MHPMQEKVKDFLFASVTVFVVFGLVGFAIGGGVVAAFWLLKADAPEYYALLYMALLLPWCGVVLVIMSGRKKSAISAARRQGFREGREAEAGRYNASLYPEYWGAPETPQDNP